jgi:hypothetical protein
MDIVLLVGPLGMIGAQVRCLWRPELEVCRRRGGRLAERSPPLVVRPEIIYVLITSGSHISAACSIVRRGIVHVLLCASAEWGVLPIPVPAILVCDWQPMDMFPAPTAWPDAMLFRSP